MSDGPATHPQPPQHEQQQSPRDALPMPDLDAAHPLYDVEEAAKSFSQNTPLGRAGQPAELAPAYVLLASAEDPGDRRAANVVGDGRGIWAA
jgi:NAD(P)-dependent dehydrogenase (short-subunit alcohol dehydrogenase family)